MKKKPDYFYIQSGVIPYRIEDGVVRVLLIATHSGRRWVIPKGIVEFGLTAAASAAKEALEEAGLEGPVDPAPIGSYKHRKWGGTCLVEVFLMKVETVFEDWAESYRRRQWMTIGEAAASVKDDELKQLIRRVPAVLGARSGDDQETRTE